MLMRLILQFYDICGEALQKGADINKLVGMEVREPIGRFKYTDEKDVDRRFDEIGQQLVREVDAIVAAKEEF